MSHPYRGDDIVSDNISYQNVQDLRSRIEEGLRPQLELLTLVDRIGGNELVEQISWENRAPKARPTCLTTRSSLIFAKLAEEFLLQRQRKQAAGTQF